MPHGRLRRFLAIGAAFVAIAVAVTLVLTHGGGGEHEFEHGVKKEAEKVAGHEGGEAGREERDKSPSMEAVAERAYPRAYVDDNRVRAERRAFNALPANAPRSAFGSARAYAISRDVAPQAWTALGPVTPNVAGEDSQFLDPSTLQGPATQESGRVTALAIDPACAGSDCKMWVAAAGGGIWRTNNALATHVQWIAPPDDLPTNSFGSLYYEPTSQTLYAGSGEPNGSGDSEAGLGLFKSTDFGASWSLVPGSATPGTNRSIGAIAIDTTTNPDTIYIGTDVARHGSSSVNGGRRTPPNAPALGVYKSSDGGATFVHETDLSDKTPVDPTPGLDEAGVDWFQGGVNKLELDPNDHNMLWAAVQGYGIWAADQSGGNNPTWSQVFHTMNQTDFSNPDNPGDTFGDRTEFDLVDLGAGTTRAYVGDASDDWAIDDDDATPAPQAWRNDDAGSISGAADGQLDNAGAGWIELSSATNGDSGFAASYYCQNGQCGYDSFVSHPPGASSDTVWFGGSMNYDELPAYDTGGKAICADGATCEPPRSNGRAVIRSTNGGAGTSGTAHTTVSWQDMTAVLSDPSQPWGVEAGIHPDLHAIAFAANPSIAFIGSDGGVVRIDVTSPQDQSASCDARVWNYDDSDGSTPPVALQAPDLADCHELLNGVPDSITPLNDGLNDIQFQSLSINPSDPSNSVYGGTQDNGTWSYTGSPAWLEVVGGDGGQSGFNRSNANIRYHNYFSATPEVNYHGDDPSRWLDTYDVLQESGEDQSFYTPFIADPSVAGRVFTGLEHVWRSDDNGGSEASLGSDCNALSLNPDREACGDWRPLGADLIGTAFGGDKSGGYVVADERAPGDNSTLWAGTRNGRVFVTKNVDDSPGSVDFRRIDTSAQPGRFVSGIAVDPDSPTHAWVSFSGYNQYTPGHSGHVFDVTYNPGTHTASWSDVSFNIGDQPVTGIVENEATGDLYAGTDFGVLRLPQGSSQWEDAAGGLPHVASYGLSLSQSGHVLYAATHGRGAYRLALPARPTGTLSGPDQLTVGQAATYSASGSSWDGSDVSFSWTLPGSPAGASGPSATFVPGTPGPATVSVTLSGGGASATLTKSVNVAPAPVKDHKRPTVRLRHVKRIRLPHKAVIRGVVRDASGISLVIVRFGDGKSRHVKLGRRGAFVVRHRYRLDKRHRHGHTFRITVIGIDKAGNRNTKHVTVRVMPRKRKHKHKH
jgi:hypothetical protein